MKNRIKYLFILCLSLVFVNCETDDGVESELSNFVGFETVTDFAVERNGTGIADIIVAASETSGADRTFNVVVDEDATTLVAPYSVPSTVIIPANSNIGTLSLSVTDNEMLSFEPQKLVISLVPQIGINVGEAIEIDVVEECVDTFATLQLDFDNWAEEAYYEIYDLSGTPTIIFEGGQGGVFTDLDNDSFVTEYCMASGDYGIVVYDTYGDGGTVFTVSANGEVLATGTVPGGNPANVLISTSATFTID